MIFPAVTAPGPARPRDLRSRARQHTNASACSSINLASASVAGPARPRESRGTAQDLVGAPQFLHLSPQPSDLGRLFPARVRHRGSRSVWWVAWLGHWRLVSLHCGGRSPRASSLSPAAPLARRLLRLVLPPSPGRNWATIAFSGQCFEQAAGFTVNDFVDHRSDLFNVRLCSARKG